MGVERSISLWNYKTQFEAANLSHTSCWYMRFAQAMCPDPDDPSQRTSQLCTIICLKRDCEGLCASKGTPGNSYLYNIPAPMGQLEGWCKTSQLMVPE